MEDLYEDGDYSNVSEIKVNEPAKLKDLLLNGPSFIPTQQDLRKGEEVLKILANALLGDISKRHYAMTPLLPSLRLRYSTIDMVTVGIIPLGFYAWGLWKPNDPISVCVCGTPSVETLFDLLRTRLSARKDLIIIEGFDKWEAHFDLLISSIKVELVYHRNPFISQWTEASEDDLAETRARVPWTPKDFYDLARTHEMAKEISSYGVGVVGRAYWAYMSWSQNLGLYPVLLNKEQTLCLAIHELSTKISLSDFSKLNLPVCLNYWTLDKLAASLGLKKTRFEQRTLETIGLVVGNSNRSAHFLPVIKTTCDFSIPQWPRFFAIWRQYIRVSVSFWGSSSLGAAGWFSSIEREIKDSQPSFPSNKTRYQFWPYPFEEHRDQPWIGNKKEVKPLAEHAPEDILRIVAKVVKDAPYLESKTGQTDFELSYLIGCDGPLGSLQSNSIRVIDEMNKRCEYALEDKDRSNGGFSIEFVARDDLEPVWYPYILKHVPNPADLREFGDHEDEVRSSSTSPERKKQKKSKSKAKGKGKQKQKQKQKAPAPTSSDDEEEPKRAYLRPASDILNRFHHDRRYKFNIDDYIIGYQDRFVGIKEIPLQKWTKDYTAQEFIPQTRIRYFKRKSDGVVIWDRNAKIDLVTEEYYMEDSEEEPMID
ncbi:MAG: hypothetical protein GOMPHAMPRED_004612 [Gomphillus americanus]|uniref:MJ1316 RNA cyclic group end recognition domain-containing protein n=1 Tax=Gomphillus americanus TaxID=1940652 RepID=A0A8H3FRR3_9LECA|nr:MAG: hypothetical protein GOMPHAMPRED_004612 [Gomphillus americanus]